MGSGTIVLQRQPSLRASSALRAVKEEKRGVGSWPSGAEAPGDDRAPCRARRRQGLSQNAAVKVSGVQPVGWASLLREMTRSGAAAGVGSGTIVLHRQPSLRTSSALRAVKEEKRGVGSWPSGAEAPGDDRAPCRARRRQGLSQNAAVKVSGVQPVGWASLLREMTRSGAAAGVGSGTIVLELQPSLRAGNARSPCRMRRRKRSGGAELALQEVKPLATVARPGGRGGSRWRRRRAVTRSWVSAGGGISSFALLGLWSGRTTWPKRTGF